MCLDYVKTVNEDGT